MAASRNFLSSFHEAPPRKGASGTPPEQIFVGDLETNAPFGRSAATGKAPAISKYVSKRPLFLEMNLERSTGAEQCGSLIRQLPAPWNTARKETPVPQPSPRQRQKLAFCSTKSNFEWSKFAPRHSPAKPPGNFDRVVTLIRCVIQSSQNFYRGFGISSAFIREGDTTSHGGRVLACTSTNVVFGKTLAL